MCGYMSEKTGCLEGLDMCLCIEGEMLGRGKDRGCKGRERMLVCAGVCVCGELVYVGGKDETSLWSEYV